MLPPSWKSEVEEAADNAEIENAAKWEAAAASIGDEVKKVAEHLRAYKEQQNTDDRKERTLNKVTIILVFLTVLFTGGSWWEFKGQLDEMRKFPADRKTHRN
jgi:hypothetical protein